MSQLDDFLNYQYAFAGRLRYDTGGGRCTPDTSGYADCSGLQIAAMHHVGLPTPQPCMASGGMWQWCTQAGTLMSIDQARFTRGAWLFVGFRGNEHIAVSCGDGRQFAAHGHFARPQVGFAPFDVNAWSGAAWPPGLDRSAAAPPPRRNEDDMQWVLYQPDGPVPAGRFAGKKPTVLALEDANGDALFALHLDDEQEGIALRRGVPLVTKPALVFDAIVIAPAFGE